MAYVSLLRVIFNMCNYYVYYTDPGAVCRDLTRTFKMHVLVSSVLIYLEDSRAWKKDDGEKTYG